MWHRSQQTIILRRVLMLDTAPSQETNMASSQTWQYAWFRRPPLHRWYRQVNRVIVRERHRYFWCFTIVFAAFEIQILGLASRWWSVCCLCCLLYRQQKCVTSFISFIFPLLACWRQLCATATRGISKFLFDLVFMCKIVELKFMLGTDKRRRASIHLG